MAFACLFLFPGAVSAQLRATSGLERGEFNTIGPFPEFRERSYQKLTYNEAAPYRVMELDYTHVIFKYVPGFDNRQDRLYHASVLGHNFQPGVEVKAGRIWTGNNLFLPVDGVSLSSPLGDKLSAAIQLGKYARVPLNTSGGLPSYAEGRLRYRFNDQAFMVMQSSQELSDHYSSFQLGYALDTLKAIGEYRSSGASDSYRLSVQYYDGKWCDINSDYRMYSRGGNSQGIFRGTVGLGQKKVYLETGAGTKFYSENAFDRSNFYDTTLSFGNSKLGQDNVSIGYLYESTTASVAQTLSGNIERVVSPNTRLGLAAADTRFNGGKTSVQNIESRLHRTVYWGFYEVVLALITSDKDSAVHKDVQIRAGYDF